jgi:hypothetical protein
MALSPAIGRPGGQEFDVARAIRIFLEGMAGGTGVSFGAAVIKELIQNADDAGASELVVTLDERSPTDLPAECSAYAPLLQPALIVRNDARFRIAGEVPKGDQDDFTAILEVAGGHKRFNPTAAGRFGIGFNSVYFLTDTPLLFSRRAVHIFDLRHLMFKENGWQFSLDEFPAVASSAGPIKTVLDWVLPKAVLTDGSFQELASLGRDYRQTVFRLPLRRTLGIGSAEHRGPVFPSASFPQATDREELLREMCEEARRSLLFLKSLRRVVFGGIEEKHFNEWARVELSPPAPKGLEEFVKQVRMGEDPPPCSFRCDVSVEAKRDRLAVASGSASFLVTHAASFKHQALTHLADRLRKNDERTVPWVGIAVPMNSPSFDWEGAGNAQWRVFLPLLEEGPCTCILNAALFVDPSRRSAEFRTDGSDESLRKSEWNQTLVEQCLVPLLREASASVIDHAPELVAEEPKKYLSLFPTATNVSLKAGCLADVVRGAFCKDLWLLRLYDLWKDPFDVWVGPGGQQLLLETVPDWLSRYSSTFEDLTTESRRFVAWKVGDALRDRVGAEGNVDLRKPSPELADRVLMWEQPPKLEDLTRLLKLLGEESLTPSALDGRWAFECAGTEHNLLRFDPGTLYLVRTGETPAVYEALDAVGISFERAEWVARNTGLCVLRSDVSEELDNLMNADDAGALELLSRVRKENGHDLLSDHRRIVPIVDFLCSQSPHRLTEDLRLGFMVKTAAGKLERRHLGTVLLRPEKRTPDEEALWQGILREAFAEVDPQFAPELRRAIEHAPQLLNCFGDDTCKVNLARGDLLDVLDDACAQDKEFIARLAEQLNASPEGQTECRPEVYRAGRLLLREADRRWDALDERLRLTVLALPIHRTASGKMISLCSAGGFTPAQIRDRYLLQSEDDLRDAPLELPTRQLLHSLDSDVRSFYRQRLEIQAQDRSWVLKECLRQIGADATHSGGILRYVARYYTDTVERLREATAGDLRELEELHRVARGVPCLDETWHRATECVDATDFSGLLARQGWREEQVRDLICELSYSRPVADTWSEEGKLAQTLWGVERLDRDLLAELAIKSDSPSLSFRDRTKVIHDNLRLVPDVPLRRTNRIDKEVCAAVGGPVELERLVIVDMNEVGVGAEVVRAALPDAADLPVIARELTDGDIPAAAAVLRALGVPTVNSASMAVRIIAGFAGMWRQLGTDARIDLLAWLGRQKTAVPTEAVSLDTVLVREKTPEWVQPDDVIAPRWATLAPPNVPAERIAQTRGIPTEVLRLWNEWCGIRELNAVVELIVRGTSQLPRESWPAASKQFAGWLDRLVEQQGAQAVAAVLQNLPWMLCRKGDDLEFRRASEVLDHAGAEVLQHTFWVVQGKMPASLAGHIQTRRLGGTREILERLAQCLASAAHASAKAAENVYELLGELVSDEPVADTWRRLASSQPVYRLFRNPDQVVSAEELFLGESNQNEDFGRVLYCFGAGDDFRKRIRQLYRKLGLGIRPTAMQLASALARLSGEPRAVEAVHSRLVDELTELTIERGSVSADEMRRIKVRSCAKTYEPLTRCYRDAELDRPSRVSAECRDRVIDGRDSGNRKLTRWLDAQFPDVVLDLCANGPPELAREPDVAAQGISTNVLDAWHDWLGELATPGSVVRYEVEQLGFALSQPIRIQVVRKIDVRFSLRDGSVVVPADDWPGPGLFHDSRDCLLVRSDIVDRDFVGQAGDVEGLDEQIADQLENLLRKRSSGAGSPQSTSGSLRDAVQLTLERPGAVLKRMREEKQDHFFHQYLDQAADPEFSNLFDEYRRTRSEEKGSSLKEKMWDLIRQRFVEARRRQIRGYGYDEFAVFAELVQNAEDAYAQREPLGLPDPPRRSVTFSYAGNDRGRTLTASHYGRPFNMWRHGTKSVQAYRYDVEGVLKSAGSFKPHSRSDGGRPIGRFGLGFKSVYLITDVPRIHSGDWHFEITAGCIPNELPSPIGYEKALTKIVLPLRPQVPEERDGKRGRYANLMPFLRQVDAVRVQHSDGDSVDLRVTSKAVLHTTDGYMVDRVEIVGARHVAGGTVRLLRVRHPDHEGQLGVLLAPDDQLPVVWNEAFDSDVFSVLPLRVRLGCGVGVSNLFEVQSGRTHLIDPAANALRIAEVARSLRGIAKALMVNEIASPREVMTRFWSLWRWDRSDDEAKYLRSELAKELVEVARTTAIVPTLDEARCVSFGEDVLFSFESIPEDFANDLLRESVEFVVRGKRVKLHKGNVVPEPIRSACERAWAAAGEKKSLPIFGIGWSELGEVFLARPWLAERPELVSAMARSLPPEKIDEVRSWLGKCLFRAMKGRHMQLADLLPPRFPGVHHLPSRLVGLLHESYDEAAVSLLKQVGLPSRPALDTIKAWVHSNLDRSECDGLLHYLSEAGRWRRDYYDLGPLLNSPWFEVGGARLTTADAFDRRLVRLEELDTDPAFRAWLGIGVGDVQISVEGEHWDHPVSDPKRSLVAIYEWWVRERDRLVRRYEERTYPGGTLPRLNSDFSDRDSQQRHGWLSLLILATMHTMGRSNPEQHRGFLHQCERMGWMDRFADPVLSADGWIGVLEEYLSTQTNDIPFYHWVRQFVSIYQIARWLPVYVASFLAIDRFKERFDLDRVIKPAMSQDFSGGGPNAPPLTRALGIGACFVVRELVRADVLKSPLAYDHSYVAVGRVRYVFARLGLADLRREAASYRHSPRIQSFLREHLGPDRAHFERCFDLPFLAIAADAQLQRRFLECELPPEGEE